jgi:hypothetical protein
MERGNTREDSEFGGSVITQTFAPSVHVKASGVFNEYSCHRLNVIAIEEELKLQSDLIGAKILFATSAFIYGANCSSHGGCKCLATDTPSFHVQPNPIWALLITHPIWSTHSNTPHTHMHTQTHTAAFQEAVVLHYKY